MLGPGHRSVGYACHHMSGPVMCACGAVLVLSVDEHGVTTVDGEYLRFERRTDFVACPSCLRSYPARDLLEPKEEPEQPVERLEKLLEADPDQSAG